MIRHIEVTQPQLKNLIQNQKVTLAGNSSLKIYGALSCSSGKRMRKENRVFFENETEAIHLGFRPCSHCMHDIYLIWKALHSCYFI